MKNFSLPACARFGGVVVFLAWIAGHAAYPAPNEFPAHRLPLYFEPNRGQAPTDVLFLARGDGFQLALKTSEALLALRRPGRAAIPLRVQWLGARRSASVEGEAPLPGRSRYFRGNDPSRWLRSVPHFARVRYREIYPGTDLVFYANGRRPEFDYVLRPGADPSLIRLRYEGDVNLSLAPDGRLRIRTPAGDLWQPPPACYQQRGGQRLAVQAGYKLIGAQEVAISLGDYDRNLELVIDPLLVWLTYYGGTGLDAATAIALDPQGNVILAGYTESVTLPAGAAQIVGAPTAEYPRDGFVVKLSADGKSVLGAAYLGGSRGDEIHALAVDGAGNVYVAGRTDSANFPVSVNALQRSPRSSRAWGEGFVAKLDANLQLVYGTYLGGNEFEQILGIAVDGAGKAHVTGETFSDDFPTTPGVVRTTPCPGYNTDVFVSKLNGNGSALEYSTFVCGRLADRGLAIAVDSAGNAYVAGETTSADFPVTSPVPQPSQRSSLEDAFVLKLNPTGTQLLYSTYLGGSFSDAAYAVALDATGAIYLGGATRSTDFPVTAGAYQRNHRDGGVHEDAFVARLTPAGDSLAFATYLGGSAGDRITALKADAAGNAYVAGFTASGDFPRSGGPCEPGPSGKYDGFAGRLAAGGARLDWMMVLGGRGDDWVHGLALAPNGEVLIAGRSTSANLPSTPGAFRTAYARGYQGGGDAFVARLAGAGQLSAPCIAAGGVLNNASYVPGPIAPGQIIAVFGEGIGPDVLATAVVQDGYLTKSLGGVRVLFNNVAAPIVFAWANQLSAIAPFALAGATEARVVVEYNGRRTNEVVLPVAASAPGIFSLNASGEGSGAIFNQDGTVNTPDRRAAPGEVIVLYATGAGQTAPAGEDGKVNPPVLPLPAPLSPVKVWIAGREAEILYAGNPPYLVHGALQVNVRIPAGTPPGAFIPLLLQVGEARSQAGLYVSVR